MNCKLEKFWNWRKQSQANCLHSMNCKLEKFWNDILLRHIPTGILMNCKLEKFWNKCCNSPGFPHIQWTVNLKSFEIYLIIH